MDKDEELHKAHKLLEKRREWLSIWQQKNIEAVEDVAKCRKYYGIDHCKDCGRVLSCELFPHIRTTEIKITLSKRTLREAEKRYNELVEEL